MQNQTELDRANVIAKPPRIYLATVINGTVLQLIWPLTFGGNPVTLISGILLICSGIGLMIWSDWEFRKAETAVAHQFGVSNLVTTGPYRFSRNPMYVSMTAIMIGLALSLNNVWLLLTLIPLILIMQIGVIQPEEAYLTAKFGQPFLDYKNRVRRWL